VNYLKIDIVRLTTSKLVFMIIVLLFAISIIDPITVLMHFSNSVDSAERIGQNPFQFWMLMNTVSWGNNVYNLLFWILASILTGLIYFEDKNTSMYMYQIVRYSRKKYLVSKFLSTWMFSFVIMLLVLEVNIIVTFILFQDSTSMTDYYYRIIPNKGSFVYEPFQSDPMYMIQIYTILNAIAISIFVVLSLCIQMLFNISNRYVALLIPVIILYGVNFIFDSFPILFAHNIRMIIQPRAVSVLSTIISWENVFVVLGGWVLVNCLLMSIIFYKSRDCYE